MNIFNRIAEKIRLHKISRSNERVKEDYQITERDGQIWITFAGYPILPSSMLNIDAITALNEIRQLHLDDKS